MNNLDKLINMASSQGVELTIKPNNHVQIHGELLVNYYPLSDRQTAYVAGTTKGVTGVSPKMALRMAFKQPKRTSNQDKRKGNSRQKRKAMLKKDDRCYWCGCELTLDTSTIEHKIPLARGGLDNANNRVLACEKCNQDRGCNMPELKLVKRK